MRHIVLPYAGWLAGAADDLPLPALHQLLSKMQLIRQDLRPETAFFYLKHEASLAAAYGLAGAESGQLPLAALARWRAGLAPAAGEVWGRISLCQWQIGMNDGQLRSPAQLQVQADEAASIWQTLAPLLAERGLQIEPYPVLPPYARHVRVQGVFADLACASLECVAGHELSDYLTRAAPQTPGAQWQNLLAEVQMLLYQHPVNDARQARRLPALNSIWLDSVGTLPPDFSASEVQVLPDLQQAAERGDLQGWRTAWLRIEAEQVPQWQAALATDPTLRIELCGLHSSAVFTAQALSWHQRLAQHRQRWRGKRPAVHWPSDLAQG